VHDLVWHPSIEPPQDEFEKVIVWTPLIGPARRGVFLWLARYIHGHGWLRRGETWSTPDDDITYWMDIPPVPVATKARARRTERPRLMRDWIGLKVTPRHDLETRAGVIFGPGTVLEVTGVYRGLELQTVRDCPSGCPECWVRHRHTITRVRPEELDIHWPEENTRT